MNNVNAMLGAKMARDNRQYSQSEIAEATGVSQSMISRIITNRVKIENVAYGILDKLAEWLGCEVADLVIREKRQ